MNQTNPMHNNGRPTAGARPGHRPIAGRTSQRRHRWAWRIAISLIITVMVAGAIATFLADDARRWLAFQRIGSADEQTMLRGLTFIYHHAEEPAVQSEVSRLLVELDDPVLRDRLILVLQRAGTWGPRFGQGWLEAIERQIDDAANDPESRALIASALTQHAWDRQPIIFEPRFADVIEPLLDDESAMVRYAALRAAMSLPPANRPMSWFFTATRDEQPTIARSAWLAIGLMAPEAPTGPGVRTHSAAAEVAAWPDLGQLLEMPVDVAQACLWAEAQWHRTSPTPGDQPTLAEQLLHGKAAATELRAMAVYVLRRDPETVDWPALISEASFDPADAGYLPGWRAVLGAPLTDRTIEALNRLIERAASIGEPADAVTAAAVCRLADRLSPQPWRDQPGHTLRQLARRECRSAGSAAFPLDPVMPELVRLLTVRANANASIDDLVYLFNSDEPTIRHYAALVAIERFDQATCHAMAVRLLGDFYDDARMAGAMLAGLSGLPAEAILRARDAEKVWLVRQHLQLALMMVGADDAFAEQARGLLIRRDTPRAAVLIALLQAGRIGALDDLLMPLGRDDGAIRRMLDEQRFRPFLARYLPHSPPFELYGDPALQQWQVALIRHWYLMHRGELQFDSAARQFRISE